MPPWSIFSKAECVAEHEIPLDAVGLNVTRGVLKTMEKPDEVGVPFQLAPEEGEPDCCLLPRMLSIPALTD